MSRFFREFVTDNPKVITANSADVIYINVNGANRGITYETLVGLIRELGLTESEEQTVQSMINTTLLQDGVLTNDNFAAVGITDLSQIIKDSDLAASFESSQNSKIPNVGQVKTYVGTEVGQAVVGLPTVSEMTVTRNLSPTDLNRYIRNSTGSDLILNMVSAAELEIGIGFEFYVSARSGRITVEGMQVAVINSLDRVVVHPGSAPVRFKLVAIGQDDVWEATSSDGLAIALRNDDTFFAEGTDAEFNDRFVKLALLKTYLETEKTATTTADTDLLATVQIADDLVVAKNYITDVDVPNNAEVAANTLKRSYPEADETKLGTISEGADMLRTEYDPTSVLGDAFDMGNMVETATNKILTAAERTKLAGVAENATANAADAALRDRTTHTGEQAISTVTGLQAALDAKVLRTEVDPTEYNALPDAAGFAEDTLIFVNDPL